MIFRFRHLISFFGIGLVLFSGVLFFILREFFPYPQNLFISFLTGITGLGVLAIPQCPSCGNRYIFSFFNDMENMNFFKILRSKECPKCGKQWD